MTLGEIYFRLVRCLYRKYTERVGIEFDTQGFRDMIRKIGGVAFQSLQKAFYLVRKCDIIEEVGSDIFQYGILVGQEDFRLCSDPTQDFCLTFPHRSLEQFFGAYFCVEKMDLVVSIRELFVSNTPLFMTEYLFLYFCLWFSGSGQEFLIFQQAGEVLRMLKSYTSSTIDTSELNLADLSPRYPVLDVRHACAIKDELVLRFFREVISMCGRVQHVVFSVDDPVSWISDTVNLLSPVLLSIRLFGRRYSKPHPSIEHIRQLNTSSSDIKITVSSRALQKIHAVLDNLQSFERPVTLLVTSNEFDQIFDVNYILHPRLGKLHLIGNHTNCCAVKAESELKHCPYLTHLCFFRVTLFDSTILALSNANKSGKLPNLTHLCFPASGSSVKGKIPILLRHKWISVTNLYLNECQLDPQDIEVLAQAVNARTSGKLPSLTSLALFLGYITDRSTPVRAPLSPEEILYRPIDAWIPFLFQNPSNLRSLTLDDVTLTQLQHVIAFLNSQRCPHLDRLGLSMARWFANENFQYFFYSESPLDKGLRPAMLYLNEKPGFLARIKENECSPIMASSVCDLQLRGYLFSVLSFYAMSRSVCLTHLQKLDISYSSGITGTLSMILCHKFNRLNTLNNCELNPDDLCSLALASAKAGFPSWNTWICLKMRTLKGNLISCSRGTRRIGIN